MISECRLHPSTSKVWKIIIYIHLTSNDFKAIIISHSKLIRENRQTSKISKIMIILKNHHNSYSIDIDNTRNNQYTII